MKRLLLILLFIPHLIFGQSKTQHEPEQIYYQLNSVNDKAKDKHVLKKISFYRDTILSSSIEFDTNGNSIRRIGMENNSVRETLNKYDNQNREIETKYFTPNGEFDYGYYYKYDNGAKLVYKLEDSFLFRKWTFIKGENITVYSEYNESGEVIYKTITVKDNNQKYLLESRFHENNIYSEYRYEYIENKKFVTRIQFDENGTKVSEERKLDEIKFQNKLEHYTEENERLFRVDYFDDNEKLIKMELFDENGHLTRLETSNYNRRGLLKERIEESFERNEKVIYVYEYNRQNRIKKVIKNTNGEKEIFRFEYQTYK